MSKADPEPKEKELTEDVDPAEWMDPSKATSKNQKEWDEMMDEFLENE